MHKCTNSEHVAFMGTVSEGVCVSACTIYFASISLQPLRVSRLKTAPAVIAWPLRQWDSLIKPDG